MDKKSILVAVIISVSLSWLFFVYIPATFDRELRYYSRRDDVILRYYQPDFYDSDHATYVNRNEFRKIVDDNCERDGDAVVHVLTQYQVMITFTHTTHYEFYIWDARWLLCPRCVSEFIENDEDRSNLQECSLLIINHDKQGARTWKYIKQLYRYEV